MEMSRDIVQKRRKSPYMESHVTTNKKDTYISNEVQLKIIL